MIDFKSSVEYASIIDPSGMSLEQTIEHRIDPLTSAVCSINGFLGEKAKFFLGQADIEALKKLERESREGCPFCSVMENGIRFPAAYCAGGIVRAGDSVGIPNLFSKSGFDGVVIMNFKKHQLFPSGIDQKDLGCAIKVGIELIENARKINGSFVHHVMGINFLLPGGSSVPHPHLQIQARSVPFSGVTRLIALSEDYRRENGGNFWEELISTEKENGKRYLWREGDVDWLVPFAPAHQKEVWGIYTPRGSLREISSDVVESFSRGISRVISYYESEGQHPFTLAFFSSPRKAAGSYFSLQVRLTARPAFKSFYTNYDTWFVPKLIGDETHTEPPEEYGKRLREHVSLPASQSD